MREITPVVKQLLILNILFFVGSEIMELIHIPAKSILSLYYFENPNFKFWQIFSHMFMHGGVLHIAFNMLALYSFGSMLERMWGGNKFLFFYISCGLGSFLLHTGITYLEMQNLLKDTLDLALSNESLKEILNVKFSDGIYYRQDLFIENTRLIFEKLNKLQLLDELNFNALYETAIINQTPMLGASGAIYGLLVAFAFLYPDSELMFMFIPFPIKAKYFVPILLLGDLYFGISGKSIFGGPTGVAHFAHIGGALVGFIMMWFWKKDTLNKNRWN